jgi:hypothetical protein
MISILFGVFLILHGLVHLLYFGHSAGFFELQPGLVWPNGSWAFSKLLGNATTRTLASVLLILAALVFVIAGVAVLAKLSWGRPVTITAASFSSLLYLLMWDGSFQQLPDKGFVGTLINLAVIVLTFILA